MEPEDPSIHHDFDDNDMPAPLVTFDLQLPDDMMEFFEVLHDVPGLDQMLVEACQAIEETLPENVSIDVRTADHSQVPNAPQMKVPTITAVIPHVNQDQEMFRDQDPEVRVLVSSRFKQLDDEALLNIEKNQYSEATKRNTKWGVGVFNAWCLERLQEIVNFNTISEQNLNENLRKFYAEAQPKNIDKRAQSMPENIAQEYHKNTLKSVRAAINRHLKDIGRNIDIVRDKHFKLANSMLNAKLKFNLRNGLSRPTQHHPIISNSELQKINAYLSKKNDVVVLRYKVWYVLAIHFVSRGIEFHPQLSINSLKFVKDEESREYLTITHETLQKNYQGGVEDSSEESEDKRMYSTESESCPIQAVKLFLSKCHPNSKSLFNQCSRDALVGDPCNYPVWYTDTPVKVKAFSYFMPDICKNAGVKRYTAHSLRATAITAMSDAGLTDRNIMYMSDHKCEESLKSYCRRPSNEQKHKISAVLDSVATGGNSDRTSSALLPRVLQQPHVANSSGTCGTATVHGNDKNLPLVPLTMSHQELSTGKMYGFAAKLQLSFQLNSSRILCTFLCTDCDVCSDQLFQCVTIHIGDLFIDFLNFKLLLL